MGITNNIPGLPNGEPPVIDLTEQVVSIEPHLFRVGDRVQRLTGQSEQEQWGTIAADADGDNPGQDLLVVDNAGVTHRDRFDELSPALRGPLRSRARPD
jgi:hypothetical protein